MQRSPLKIDHQSTPDMHATRRLTRLTRIRDKQINPTKENSTLHMYLCMHQGMCDASGSSIIVQ